MTPSHTALVMLAVFLPVLGFKILTAMWQGQREPLAYLVPGTVAVILLCVGFSLWPTSPATIFSSIGGVLRFVVGMLLMRVGLIVYLRRCIAAMPRR